MIAGGLSIRSWAGGSLREKELDLLTEHLPTGFRRQIVFQCHDAGLGSRSREPLVDAACSVDELITGIRGIREKDVVLSEHCEDR